MLAVAAILGAAVAFPLAVVASHQFNDVPNSHTFHADIDAIADAGVTFGCGGDNYCPDSFVTRGQMAAFLNRLGALGPGKVPVANATRLDGKDSTDFLAADPIRMMQVGPWIAQPSSGATVTPFVGSTSIAKSSGFADIFLHLNGPASIGAQAYGIEQVEVCFGASASVTIIQTNVSEATASGSMTLAADATDRAMASAGCYSLVVTTPSAAEGGATLAIALDFDAMTIASFRRVTTTWVPVG